ncbi:hypothetical protein SynSYN20_01509 [Synechococcus sp. SYN20]|nr:hypothetical protein SynSYN20_01509 [Synechococcus sp. SYN20]
MKQPRTQIKHSIKIKNMFNDLKPLFASENLPTHEFTGNHEWDS